MTESGHYQTEVQEGLLIVTHQLQGPLIAVMGALSSIDQESLPPNTRNRVAYSKALLEDALTICYGMFASFAQATGTEISLHRQEIDVLTELRKLCERLQKTTARADLRFLYYADPSFPTIKMDRNVFTSVFYSLVHNAMKYAAQHSAVHLTCLMNTETGNATVAVSSRGVPILPGEREAIFERFTRGKEVSNTGRSYGGVGLGLWIARQLIRAAGGDLNVKLTPSTPALSAFVVHIPTGQLNDQPREGSLGLEQRMKNGPAIFGGATTDVEKDPMV